MAIRLDPDVLADALSALTDWSGTEERIARRVTLPEPALTEVLARVREAADAMDHHPRVTRSEGSATFTLWTHSEGGVTELDIALASRIDDLVNVVTGRGSVVGAPTDEGLGTRRLP
jgi:4a-hydroxytetrahydrobiopterin dehydratase